MGGGEARRGCRSCDRCRDVSSRVTTRRVIPNCFNGSDHAAYRAVVDALPRGVTVKTLADIGTPYAVRTQSSGSAGHRISRKRWSIGSETTTRHRGRAAATQLKEVAERFGHMIRALLETRRGAPTTDVTSELLGTR